VDILRRGEVMLSAIEQRSASRPVRYVRGAVSVDLLATVGVTEFERQDNFGMITRVESRDYIFPFESLGEEPQRGDRIEEDDEAAGVTYIYELLYMADTPAWRYSDPDRITIRVHTKLVGTNGGDS
jgi:hypothetical protein